MTLPPDAQHALLAGADRRRWTRLFHLTPGEATAAARLLRESPVAYADPIPASVRQGLARLHDRGWLEASEGSEPGSVLVDWAHPQAAAAAARHLIRHYGHGSLVRAAISRQTTRGHVGRFTPAELALLLAWHYRHTDTHTLRIVADGDHSLLTELRHHRPARTHRLAPAGLDPRVLSGAGVEDYDDRGERFSEPGLAYLTRQVVTRPDPDLTGGAQIDLDALTIHPLGHRPAGFTATLPAFTQDAAAFLDAPPWTDVAGFVAWAERALLVTVPCGTDRHRLRVNPHTHAVTLAASTPAAVQRWRGEHLLTAFGPDPTLGCDRAADAVALFGDQSQYLALWAPVPASVLSAARVIARTVQYLDAGLDLSATVPFLRVGLTAEQATRMLARQQDDPEGMRERLLGWAKFHWTAGPVGVAQAPLDG